MSKRWRPWLAALVGFLAGNATMWWYSYGDRGSRTIRLVADARRALGLDDLTEAERLANRALGYSRDSTAALLIAGEAAAKSHRLEDAVAYYDRVPDRGDETSFKALSAKSDALFHLGRFADAEAVIQRTLEIDPRNELMLERYAALLDTVGRRWASRVQLLKRVKLGKFTVNELCLLANYNDPLDVGEITDLALKTVPDDLNPLLATARVRRRYGKNSDAVELLWKVVRSNPANLEAQGLLGTILIDIGAERAFFEWRKQLPKGAEADPGIWFALGMFSKQEGGVETAARCFWEALRLEPDHFEANYQLSLVLRLLQRRNWAEAFDRRAQLLSQLNNDVHAIYAQGVLSDRMPRIAERLEALGRFWEAWAWSIALVKQGNAKAAADRDRLFKLLGAESPPQTAEKFNPALQFDLSHYPLPDSPASSTPKSVLPDDSTSSAARVAFIESSRPAGIDFSYFNGDDLESKGMKIHQTLGGGIAAFDYDGDGWPDLHFTQGAREVLDDDDPEHFDRLYRNLGDGRFADVTFLAGVADNRYSQGATVGDYDNDGFPDLFVSNIGKSRLYRSNGDGTFFDATDAAGIDLNHWSTSSLLADLNADGLPDIYDVTYLQGDEVYHRSCGSDLARACTPLEFEGEQDHLLLNLGDGRFKDVTSVAGLTGVMGKGLGILAADFERSGQLSLVVANDTEMNFFLVNRTARPGGTPRFEDHAVSHGLAYDQYGHTQANMGIAADDCNGDGLLDLYITTFYQEVKTLRIQHPDQMFVDTTRESNLRDASFYTLGFGTQFLDGDLDGWPDLVVANGNVDDFTHLGRPFEMQPQYYRNVGRGRFTEVPAAALGPYFEARHLGRSLVRLDWNRDGREDFAVSHLNAPSALITNETASAGRFLAVRLIATGSARDAIGAIATLTSGSFTRVRELTAGDGYFASNERRLVFGLGDRTTIDKLTVRWPSGRNQEYAGLAVDQDYILIENREVPVLIRVDR